MLKPSQNVELRKKLKAAIVTRQKAREDRDNARYGARVYYLLAQEDFVTATQQYDAVLNEIADRLVAGDGMNRQMAMMATMMVVVSVEAEIEVEAN